MALGEDLARIAAAAARHAADGEAVEAVLPTEPREGERVYLCAYARNGDRTWLALDEAAEPVSSRVRVREAVSIAALCELAEDAAGGGDLEELRSQLVSLRLTENPPGIDEAEEAALALETVIGAPPRLASPRFLDDVGVATRRLEHALGQGGPSPFAEAMKHGAGSADRLAAEVESAYKLDLT